MKKMFILYAFVCSSLLLGSEFNNPSFGSDENLFSVAEVLQPPSEHSEEKNLESIAAKPKKIEL